MKLFPFFKSEYIFYCIVLSFSIILYDFANGKMQSYFMLFWLYVSPFVLVIKSFCHKFASREHLLLFFILFLIIDSIYNIHSFRLSTIAFSCMFIFTYLYFTTIVDELRLSPNKIVHFLSNIVKMFCFVLVIQQIATIFHLPVFNRGWLPADEYKWNSLANEPSYIAQTLLILIFTVVKFNELIAGKKLTLSQQLNKDKYLWISYLYTNLTCFSVSCVIAVVLLSFYFFKLKNIVSISLFIVLLSCGILCLADNKLILRLLDLFSIILTLDPVTIYNVDPSSSARIIPFIYYFNEFEILNINFWLGFGCDYADNHWINLLFNGNSETSQGIGGIINNMYDYGLVPFVFFFRYIIKLVGFKSFYMFLYITAFLIFGLNLYLTWIYLMMCFTYIVYKDKYQLSLGAST